MPAIFSLRSVLVTVVILSQAGCSAGQLLGAYNHTGFGIQRVTQDPFKDTRFVFEINGRPAALREDALPLNGGEVLRIQGGDLQKFINQYNGRLLIESRAVGADPAAQPERYYAEVLQVTEQGVVLKLPERSPESCTKNETLMLNYQNPATGQMVTVPLQNLTCGSKVQLPVVIEDVLISGFTPQLSLNQPVPFQASITLSDGSQSQQIIWTSSNPDVVRVDANGNVIAVTPGKAVITATAAEDPNKSSSVGVSSDGSAPPVVVHQVVIQNPIRELMIGGTHTFQGQVVLSDGTLDRDLRWISSNPSVLRVDENGVCEGIEVGYAVVSAVSRRDPSKSFSMVVEIPAPGSLGSVLPGGSGAGSTGGFYVPGVQRTVQSLSLPYTQLTLALNNTVTSRALVRYADGSTDNRVTWYSSNPMVVNISPTGIITAIGNGTATITAYAQDDFSKSASLSVAVGGATPGLIVSSVEVVPAVILLRPGEYSRLGALVRMSNGSTNTQVRWESSSPFIRISPTGEVTALAQGTAEVRAVSLIDNQKSASATILVQDFASGGSSGGGSSGGSGSGTGGSGTGGGTTPTPTPTPAPTATPLPGTLSQGPVLVALSPSSGINSAAVTLTLTGNNFSTSPAARVFLGSLELIPFNLSNTRILVNVPAGMTPGIYDLRIQNPDGLTAVALAAYTALTPQAASGNVLINFSTGGGPTPTPSSSANVNLSPGFGSNPSQSFQQGTGQPATTSGVNVNPSFGGTQNGSFIPGVNAPGTTTSTQVNADFNGTPTSTSQTGQNSPSGQGSVQVAPQFEGGNTQTQPAPSPTPSSVVQVNPQF